MSEVSTNFTSTSRRMAWEKLFGLDLQRKPVSSVTVSSGPPLSQAITGFRAYMASTGTMPKCSAGVRRQLTLWRVEEAEGPVEQLGPLKL